MKWNVVCVSSLVILLVVTMTLPLFYTLALFSHYAHALSAPTRKATTLHVAKLYDVSGTALTKTDKNTGIVPTARSVFDTGSMSIPSSASGFIIYIPDEAHHSISEQKTMSLKNAHFIPSNLTIPSGTSIAYVHGDPNHVHVEIVKDAKSGKIMWQTVPVKHPGSSDIRVLPIGDYRVTDAKYGNMTGTITVTNTPKASTNNLVIGGIFVPTPLLGKYEADLTAGKFRVLSTYDFVSKTVQKDINGPTALVIYSTNSPMQDALNVLKPLIMSLPYR